MSPIGADIGALFPVPTTGASAEEIAAAISAGAGQVEDLSAKIGAAGVQPIVDGSGVVRDCDGAIRDFVRALLADAKATAARADRKLGRAVNARITEAVVAYNRLASMTGQQQVGQLDTVMEPQSTPSRLAFRGEDQAWHVYDPASNSWRPAILAEIPTGLSPPVDQMESGEWALWSSTRRKFLLGTASELTPFLEGAPQLPPAEATKVETPATIPAPLGELPISVPAVIAPQPADSAISVTPPSSPATPETADSTADALTPAAEQRLRMPLPGVPPVGSLTGCPPLQAPCHPPVVRVEVKVDRQVLAADLLSEAAEKVGEEAVADAPDLFILPAVSGSEVVSAADTLKRLAAVMLS